MTAKINYKNFIEDNFMILDYKTQQPVQFRFNSVQSKYHQLLIGDYPSLDGIREILLKARREGMSSYILALFTVDFILRPYSVSICFSHKKGATELLFKQVKFYLQSFCDKRGISLKDYLSTETKGMIENKVNGAMFYIGTAGAKVGGRGGYARNIHFSECAFYQDTEIITAREIVESTAQQVPQDLGMIFIESTANGEGNYYQEEWVRAYEDHASTYLPRFFGWQEFYTEEEVERRRKDFQSDAMWRQEYPRTPEEAFILSGSPFFEAQVLQAMLDTSFPPVDQASFAPDGLFI